jgi:5,10-methylene-tetrahydrofolate dehydrogenase/methenyl tetrahydrofolate cyclohydrolase
MINIEYLKNLINTIKKKQNNYIEKKDRNIIKLKKMNCLFKKKNKKINSYFFKLKNNSKNNINNYVKIITELDLEHKLNVNKILDKINKLNQDYELNNILIQLIENKINDLTIIDLHKNILQLNSDSSEKELIENIIELNKII